MRLTGVDLYSANFSEAITFSLRDVDSEDTYQVRTILGLDADEIIPKFYGFGLQTKPRFYDFGLKAREVVIRAILNPNFRVDESYSDIRDQLYRAISANRTGMVALHFRSGATIVAKIEGFITKFEVPYFVKLPEVQLTIKCDDPMFRAINPVVYTTGDFNEDLSDIYIPDSLSTAPHGFSFKVTFTATVPGFTMQDVGVNPEWKFNVAPSGGFLSGDQLYFSSDFSNRYLYMVRGAVTTHLFDRVEPTSIWPTMFPGINHFYLYDTPKFTWNTLEYYAAYWGV
jgi:hypothetical protein